MASSQQFAVEENQFEVDIPVVDISKFPQDLQFDGQGLVDHPLVATVRQACKEWGFFRLVNHGIPQDLLQDIQSVSRELFGMPAEAKDRATNSNPGQSYFRSPGVPTPYETLCFPDSLDKVSVEETCKKIWFQQGNKKFCETIGRYSLILSDLAEKIIKIIIASLCLDVNTFYESDFKRCNSNFRINHYSSHGKSIGEEALLSHADVGCITILYQDEMGGLEIRSAQRKWFSVKPQSYSFIVNVGDSLKAWSNGRYRSAEHRVVYKGWTERISIGLFYVFPDEKEIWAPADLVDKNNSRRYKPFIFSRFRDRIQNYDVTEKDKTMVLEQFAGI